VSVRRLHDHTTGAPPEASCSQTQNIFKRERLEVETVAGVIVVETVSGLQLIMMVS